MTDTKSGSLYKLVSWNINLVKPGVQIAFPPQQEVIRDCTTLREFKNDKVAEFAARVCSGDFPQEWTQDCDYPPKDASGRRCFPREDGKYIRVFAEVLKCFEGPCWDFETEQIRALEKIAANLGDGDPHRHRVQLPKTRLLAGTLNSKGSEFGDEFLNFPDFLGESPKPGETMLSGWVQVAFAEPQGNYADFILTYHAVGTPVQIGWGGGQQYDFLRTQCFPTPFLNGVDTTNRGRLNLETGKVDNVVIFSNFQGTTIARTDKVNRIPYAFPFIYPPLPLPEGVVPPPEYRPPIPPPRIFADLKFDIDPDGHITGFDLRSETFAPTGLFPFLPPMTEGGLFPPFSWGRDYAFHFANPDQCLLGTPPAACPNDRTNPDGILHPPESYSVYFHPHINLVCDQVAAADPNTSAPAGLPEPTTNSVTAAAHGKVYSIGGTNSTGITNAVFAWDLVANEWSKAAPLPTAVSSAQGAVVDGLIYVFGGYLDDAQKVSAEIQVFDPKADTWAVHGQVLPIPVAEATATAVGEKIYIVSGVDGAGEITPAVQIFDAKNETWSEGAPAAMPAASASAISVGNQIYVLGGRLSAPLSASSRTGLYEIATDQWALGPDLMTPVYGAVAGRVGSLAFIAGGRSKVDGDTTDLCQQLDLSELQGAGEAPADCDDQGWRRALPELIPTAGSGGVVVGGTLHVVGGRSMTGADTAPGLPTELVQSFRSDRGWSISEERPAATSAGILNQAGVAIGPSETSGNGSKSLLSPGCRAVVLGQNLDLVTAVEVEGNAAQIIDKSQLRLNLLLPTKLSTGTVPLTLVSAGAKQAPPIPIPVTEAAPGLYLYTFGETHEPTFLEHGPALACNEDQSLNFADQPATPNSSISLWATGLEALVKEPIASSRKNLEVYVGWNRRKGKLLKVSKGPSELPGVQIVTVQLPDKSELSNNTPVKMTYQKKIASNPVVISIREDAKRREPPVPCAAGLFFVFPPAPVG